MPDTCIIIAAAAGYLLGSLPFGWAVARSHGVDIFKAGSGNPGATNVRRVLGPRAGNIVFSLDALKGMLAAGWPLLLAPGEACSSAGIAGLVAAVLGHSFSVFTRFRGGKGVATTAGGLLILLPLPCVAGTAAWLLVFYGLRYVSLASITAAAVVAGSAWVPALGTPFELKLLATLLGILVIGRHHLNIRRLLNGTENRFARKPPATSAP